MSKMSVYWRDDNLAVDDGRSIVVLGEWESEHLYKVFAAMRDDILRIQQQVEQLVEVVDRQLERAVKITDDPILLDALELIDRMVQATLGEAEAVTVEVY